jgi:hypothetical protein
MPYGAAYRGVRHPGGRYVGLLYPDCAANPVQSRHLDHHRDGTCVDLVREAEQGRA